MPGASVTTLVGRIPRRRAVAMAVAISLFAYLVFIRTRGISQTFWLLGDQMLYWRIALGSWRDLPIGGGPSQVGGTTLGPVFCWVLWSVRHLIGPFTHNLPHAGGIGLSIIQSAADVFLFFAIWRRSASLALALAVTLVVATSPYDMALTATIWNPPLAVALVKMSIACVLMEMEDPGRSIWWSVGATATALLAVQAHSSSIFLAAPVIGSFAVRELLARRWTMALQVSAVLILTVLILEAPYLTDRMMHPAKGTSPAVVVDSVAYTVAHPTALRPIASFRALTRALEFILLSPWAFAWTGVALVACAAVTLQRSRSDITFICATVVPLIAAVAGFSLWQGAHDHYWFLVLAPSAALTVAWALTAWRPAASPVAIVLLAIALFAQSPRLAQAGTIHRLPEYGPLARGSLEIRRYTPTIRRIETEFTLPFTADATFLYEVLGGRVTNDARFSATIARTGDVVFMPVPVQK